MLKNKLLRTVSIVLTSISAADTAEFTLVDKKAGIKPGAADPLSRCTTFHAQSRD